MRSCIHWDPLTFFSLSSSQQDGEDYSEDEGSLESEDGNNDGGGLEDSEEWLPNDEADREDDFFEIIGVREAPATKRHKVGVAMYVLVAMSRMHGASVANDDDQCVTDRTRHRCPRNQRRRSIRLTDDRCSPSSQPQPPSQDPAHTSRGKSTAFFVGLQVSCAASRDSADAAHIHDTESHLLVPIPHTSSDTSTLVSSSHPTPSLPLQVPERQQQHPSTSNGPGRHYGGSIGPKTTSKGVPSIPSSNPTPYCPPLDNPAYEDLERMDPIDLANRMVFGFNGFRAPQRDVIQAAVQVRPEVWCSSLQVMVAQAAVPW